MTVKSPSFLKGYADESAPPGGLGSIYLITNRKWRNNREQFGYYIGKTTRAAAVRWLEHIENGRRSLNVIYKNKNEGTHYSKGKNYYYTSRSNEPLYAAMAIAHGKWKLQNFSKRFDFEVLGYYSLYSLDKREADALEGRIGSKFSPGGTFREVIDERYYNLRGESKKYGGASFISASNLEKILAIHHYILYELDKDPDAPSVFKQLGRRTEGNLVSFIAKFLSSDSMPEVPAAQKAYVKLDTAIKAVSSYLKIKTALGDLFYIMQDGKLLRTRRQQSAMLGTMFSLKGKTIKGLGKTIGAAESLRIKEKLSIIQVQTKPRTGDLSGTPNELIEITAEEVTKIINDRQNLALNQVAQQYANEVKKLAVEEMTASADKRRRARDKRRDKKLTINFELIFETETDRIFKK